MINSVSGLPAITIDKTGGLNSDKPKPKGEGSEVASALSKVKERNAVKRPNQDLTKDENQIKKQNESTEINYGKIAEKIGELVSENNLAIEFSKDQDTNKMIMKVYDNETDEVIQQFPPEISLKIARIVATILDNGTFTDSKV